MVVFHPNLDEDGFANGLEIQLALKSLKNHIRTHVPFIYLYIEPPT